ncbi:MAG: hypothetical protein ACE5HI_16090, partial [bacterium]
MKKIEIFVPIFLIFLLNSFAITQTPKLNPNNEYFLRNTKRINQIRKVLKREFENSPKRPDYPIQDFYHLPVEKSSDKLKSRLSDSTPPSTPSNLEVIKESIHSIFARWTASTDLESGIDYYAYAIGTQPGEADIRWWQSVGQNTNTYAASLAELGIPEDSTFYIAVYAVNGAGMQSPAVCSPPISLHWEDLGDPGNTLTIAFADFGYDSTGANITAGWDSTEIQTMRHFITRMNPIIEEI